MSERVTMADIAKEAGVHKTTVSLALREHRSIPLKTRNRIRAIAEQMGYRPDPALRALVSYRNKKTESRHRPTLAFLTDWGTRLGWRECPGYAASFEGARQRAGQLGYQLEHFWLGEPHLTHRRMSDILMARGIHGVLVGAHRADTVDNLALDWAQFCGVRLGYFPRNPALHSVANDQRAVMQMACGRILARGYRRIGLLLDQTWDRLIDRAWMAGFLAEQQLLERMERVPLFEYAGRTCREERAGADENDDGLPPEGLAVWLNEHRPEVVIGNGTLIQSWLRILGVSVPEDVALVDLMLGGGDKELAGVRQNHGLVGETAVDILAAQLAQNRFGVPSLSTSTLVEGTWVEGASLPPLPNAVRRVVSTTA